MTISYDVAADVLYIQFAESDGVECEHSERQEGIIVRQDPSTGRVFGCTITAFRQRVARDAEITIPEIGAVPSSVLTRIARASR